MYYLSVPLNMNEITFTPKRQDQILELVGQQGKLCIADIADQFNISPATARRDVNKLAKAGKIRRYHGGALKIVKAEPEKPILRRSEEQREEKVRIGAAAAALVEDNETIFLGSGSTVLEVAKYLVDKHITVITNSLPIILLFLDNPNIGLIALGGEVRASEKSFIGHITESSMQELRADKVIIGIRAISLEQGLTNDYLPETLTDRAIMSLGQQLIIVADHTKFGRVSTALVAPISRLDIVVTDKKVEKDIVSGLEEQDIQVILV